MPEGHTVHRIAKEFNARFAGRRVAVSSPQGRFAVGAAIVNEQKLVEAVAIGKQLFLHFEHCVLRIHLGIYGKWAFADFVGRPPEPVGQVRARFICETRVADLRGPTACELIDLSELPNLQSKLGPDPLHDDLRGEQCDQFIANVRDSSQSIALLLMNQAVIAGIGNVYRAELLFRARVNPHRSGKDLPAVVLKNIWNDAVELMRHGVETGVMVTRDEFLVEVPPTEDRYFVYKRSGQPCRECGQAVSIEILAGRKLYWCGNCQK